MVSLESRSSNLQGGLAEIEKRVDDISSTMMGLFGGLGVLVLFVAILAITFKISRNVKEARSQENLREEFRGQF